MEGQASHFFLHKAMQASAAAAAAAGYLYLCTMHGDAVSDDQSDG